MLKQFKIIKLAPTCFGSRRNRNVSEQVLKFEIVLTFCVIYNSVHQLE